MLLKGKIEKAELQTMEPFGESVVVLTIQNGELTFVVPLPAEEIVNIRLGETMTLDVDVHATRNRGIERQLPVRSHDENEQNRPLTPRERRRLNRDNHVPNEPKEDSTSIPPKPLSEEAIKQLYEIRQTNNEIVHTPSIETTPETVTLEEFKQATGILEEKVKEVEKPVAVRENMTVNLETQTAESAEISEAKQVLSEEEEVERLSNETYTPAWGLDDLDDEEED